MTNIDLSSKTDREILILLVDHVNSVSELVCKQNGRVRDLEIWRALITGGLGIVVLVVPAITALLLRLIK